ncbi:MAG TPA: stage V sporulation protein T [Candidatus Limivivens merdigallinarum]|uniref:Stage V sporulation protein T n=1 Tax=Candidatus Limivivens merdigallinarum TaxID=2840859 RepID=A0A9D0ZW91_9FIRM|nr:stage V sporulation protein T [Candidatus Limivivens merdigallinarum]
MKATGIVRRIDDLGRVVIPKEIRRTLRIKEGDPLEIFTDREGEVILKKYSPIGELGTFAKEYAEALAQSSGHQALITDRDHVIAVSGGAKKEWVGRNITSQLEDLIQAREQVLKNQGDGGFVKITGEENEGAEAVCPIIAEGDAIGAVILLGKEPRGRMGETEKVLVKCAAGFLGRQMEQ